MSEEEIEQRRLHWTIDKSIPIAVLFAFFMQAGAAVWYVSGLESRQTQTERSIAELAQSDSAQNDDIDDVTTRTTRIEVDLNAVKVEMARRLSNIDAKLDRIIERLPPLRVNGGAPN
jgi:hypothetical protein